ncbi:trans-sialidase [Trypanosoma cruzi]|nr:trans-sialidase [Trypanosoma cruzi]
MEANANTGLQLITMKPNLNTTHMVGGKFLKLSFPFENSAVVTKERRFVVFLLQPINANGLTISSLIYSEDDKIASRPHYRASAEGGRDVAIVDWEDAKLHILSLCHLGNRRVHGGRDDGKAWTEAVGTPLRVCSKNGTELVLELEVTLLL